MYSSWRCSAGVVKAAAPPPPPPPSSSTRSQATKPTLQVPEALMKSLAGKWHLPKELIINSSTRTNHNSNVSPRSAVVEKAGKSTTTGGATEEALARRKLSRGFELLFHLLTSTSPSPLSSGRRHDAATSVLSRRELDSAVSRWSLALQLSDRQGRQLRQLLDDFWGLMDDLTVRQVRWRRQRENENDDAGVDSLVSLADVLEGLRTRVRTGRDLMELRRRLLQLAGGLFAVLSAAGGNSTTTATTATWTAQLLDALAAALGADRATEVRAALLVTKGPQLQQQPTMTTRFGELHRDAWLRLVHEQFF